MSTVRLVSVTPNAEDQMMYCARVSNPVNQESKDARLLSYCIKHGHWSVFEMAHMTVEITTTRAISAQIIRHRSFSFQESSLRYSEAQSFVIVDGRRQDEKNRQNSIDDLSDEVQDWWHDAQSQVIFLARQVYQEALDKGIAKECARAVLPLLTTTKIYMTGSVRSWIHYLDIRTAKETQAEHREVAEAIREVFIGQFPVTAAAMGWAETKTGG